MCTAVAIAVSNLPKRLFAEYDLLGRVHDRGGNQPEVWFAIGDPDPVLPVMDGGVLKLVRWGSRNRSGLLQTTGWTWKKSVEAGEWTRLGCQTEPVVIPVGYGCEKGVWFKITEGIHGILVRPPDGLPPAVYMICDEPTRYYRVMTRGERMPWLAGELI
jgi:hypothetical protein